MFKQKLHNVFFFNNAIKNKSKIIKNICFGKIVYKQNYNMYEDFDLYVFEWNMLYKQNLIPIHWLARRLCMLMTF